MTAVLSRTNFQTASKIVRWSGIGVQAEPSNGAVLSELTSQFTDAETAQIRLVADEISRGKLPAQDVCRLADAELQRIYAQGQVEIV